MVGNHNVGLVGLASIGLFGANFPRLRSCFIGIAYSENAFKPQSIDIPWITAAFTVLYTVLNSLYISHVSMVVVA